MKTKKTIEQEINEFLEKWDCKQLTLFVNDIIPLLQLYDVDEEDDWVRDSVGEDNLRNVRLIRTVYLISKIAENHSAALCSTKMNFRNIFKRLEDTVDEHEQQTINL